MHLKKALWRSTTKVESKKTEDEKSKETSTTMTAVEELANSLMDQRLYREVTLALSVSLRDCRAEFSFLRLRGLRSLLNFLKSVTQSDSTINLFCETQSIPDLQVVPVLFQHSLKEWEEVEDNKVDNLNHIFGVEPMKITSPATDSETVLALRVLEGCSLIHHGSTILAHQYKGVQVLTHILATRGKQEQAACLDALISIMLDSSANLTDFEDYNGIEDVSVLIRDKQVDENLRLRCGEFLLLLIGHVNGRERPPMATVHEDIRRLLGEKTASLIWAASQFGSTLDPEQRVIALHIQARRVLESLELY